MTIETTLKSLLQKVYGETGRDSEITHLTQHASARQYYRVTFVHGLSRGGEKSIIAMVYPKDNVKSEEAGSGKEKGTHLHDFVLVQESLATMGVRVPAIEYDALDEDGILLLEDLGDTTLEDVLLSKPTLRLETYRSVVELLASVQKKYETKRPKGIWDDRSFDKKVLHWELMHFYDWAIDARFSSEGEKLKAPLEEAFNHVVEELSSAPQTLVLRDYQSRNIMQKGGEWVLIDFQDALMGPFCYDLVALLRDSYVSVFPNELDQLLNDYIEETIRLALPWSSLGAEEIRHYFYLQTLQRKLKDAGRFIFIRDVKGNDSFIKYFDPSIDYVKWALEKLNKPIYSPIAEAVDLALSKSL